MRRVRPSPWRAASRARERLRTAGGNCRSHRERGPGFPTHVVLMLDGGGVRAVATSHRPLGGRADDAGARRSGQGRFDLPQSIARSAPAASCRPRRRTRTARPDRRPHLLQGPDRHAQGRARRGARQSDGDRARRRADAVAAPELTLTLARNRQWWTNGALLSTYQRVGFPDSGWCGSYYPGRESRSSGWAPSAPPTASTTSTTTTRWSPCSTRPSASAVRGGGIAWE